MIGFLRQHVIRLAIISVCILILLGAVLSYYNRYVMNKSLVIKEQTDAVLQQVDYIQENIRFMDISSRGYALIRKPQFLFWNFRDAQNRNKQIFGKLDSLFLIQEVNDPTYPKIKIAMDEYTRMFGKMVQHLDDNQDTAYIEMLEFDYGKIFYQTFQPFFNSIDTYERELNQHAQQQYEAAVDRNTFVQFLLLIIGLPTLVWIMFKISKDEKNQTDLLLDLEDNNKAYLFDNGNADAKDARTILGSSIQNLQKASDFVNKISEGNYSAEWEGLNHENESLNKTNLAGRLLYMRDEMKRVKEEDNKRIWATQGLSEFSDLIRKYQNDLKELNYNSLIYLVKYTGSQQGSLFIIEEDEDNKPYLNMTACYAFERKKFLQKRINIGEGLVGQTFLESRTVLLKEVPSDYIQITSGLGDATPTCVILVPLKHNDLVLGIVEMATFKEYLPHQINFLEKAGEFVASALASAQQNEKTKRMMEQMQTQAQQMREQEEELRQNLEELEATQEAMKRKNMESENETMSIS